MPCRPICALVLLAYRGGLLHVTCRGTYMGVNYHSFNAIPAVWDQFFGGKAYSALAAGIAGDTPSPSSASAACPQSQLEQGVTDVHVASAHYLGRFEAKAAV